MLEKARKTLNDFIYSVDCLDGTEDLRHFQLLCIAASSLNRAIGFVLQNDDNPLVKKASNKLYQEWQSDEACLFSTFIKPYRDYVQHCVELGLDLYVPGFVVISDGTNNAKHFENNMLYIPFNKDIKDEKDKFHPELFGDLDVRDVFHDSISWWNEQLERIELAVKEEED